MVFLKSVALVNVHKLFITESVCFCVCVFHILKKLTFFCINQHTSGRGDFCFLILKGIFCLRCCVEQDGQLLTVICFFARSVFIYSQRSQCSYAQGAMNLNGSSAECRHVLLLVGLRCATSTIRIAILFITVL